MSDNNDTIEVDRERMEWIAWKLHEEIRTFAPPEEFAELVSEDPDMKYEEELGYARGGVSAAYECIHNLEYVFGNEYDFRELAEEYAEKHDLNTFDDEEFWEDK